MATGTRQVVILGAAELDTFAYRNPYPELRVFEGHHPATQAWKRPGARLATAGIVPSDVHPCLGQSFWKTQDLAADSRESTTFTRTEPAIFRLARRPILYLTPSAAGTTLGYIAGQTQPAEVVFDYLQPADTDEEQRAPAGSC